MNYIKIERYFLWHIERPFLLLLFAATIHKIVEIEFLFGSWMRGISFDMELDFNLHWCGYIKINTKGVKRAVYF